MSVIRLHDVQPVLRVRDVPGSLAWYRDVLDFEVGWTWGDPPERGGVVRDGVELQLVGPDAPFGPEGSSVVYVRVSGVDDYFAGCRERGAPLEIELGDRPFGMRDFRVADPSGNLLGFGERIGGAGE